MKSKLLLTIMVIGIALMTSVASAALAPLEHGGFDFFDLTAAPGYYAGVTAWNSLSSTTYNPDVYESGNTPAAHSGDNALFMEGNSTAIIWQVLKDTGGNDILIEANKTYTVTLWAGRITGLTTVAPQLEVALNDLNTFSAIVSETKDLSGLTPGADLVEQTFTLETGAAPGGLGNSMYLSIRNTNDTTGYQAYNGRVALDSVSIVPEPATLALLGLGGLVLRRRKR